MKSDKLELVNLYWDGYTPVNIANIAVLAGVNIIMCDQNYIVNGSIYLNKNNNIHKMRYITAYSLIKILIDNCQDLKIDNSLFDANWYYDDNSLTVNLLMPDVAIEYLIKRKGICDITKLSKEFLVSEQAVYFRLKCLGYIK